MNIGINASNVKSVGGINHIYNLLFNLNEKHKKRSINKIYVWASKKTFNQLSKIKKKNIIIKKIKYDNIFYNLLWKLFILNFNLKKNNCDLLFSLDGIVLRKFKKTIILYQNLIPFNYQEIVNYGLSIQTLKNIFIFYLYRFSKNKADGFIFLNKFGKNLIEKKIGKTFNNKIIPHGVNKNFINLKINKKNNENCLDIIYISPIDLYKHQWNVIQAVKEIKTKKINLHIVGPTSNKKSMKIFYDFMKEANSKIKIINYYGAQSEKKIIKILKKGDIFLFASSCESFGLTLIEGMSTNLSILCSNLSGMRETTKNKAIYFNPLNYLSIVEAINIYLKSSSIKIKENINSTKKIAETFNWSDTTRKTFDFISDTFLQKKNKINNFKDYINLKYLFQKYNENTFIFSYIFNFFLPVGFFFIFYLSDKKYLSVEYAIIISITTFLNQLFSANMRSIIIADEEKNTNNIILFRLFFTLIASVFLILIFTKLYSFNFLITIFAISLSGLIWIKEIVIAYSEIRNKKILEKYSQLLLLSFFTFSLILFYYFNSLFFLLLVPFFIFLELILRCKIINLELKSKNLFHFNLIISNFNLSYAFFSSFFLSFLNIIIRILTDFNFSKLEAADYLFCFSIATFPGTLVASILGVSFLKNENRFPIYFSLLIYVYFFIFITAPFANIDLFVFNTKIALMVICFSGLMSAITQSIRQLNIINAVKRRITFKRDIVFFFLSVLILFIFITYLKNYFIFYISIISVISFIIYLSYYEPKEIVKNIQNESR